jgi:hypothetical protein
MADRETLDEAINRMRDELRALIDPERQGFILAANNGERSIACATGTAETLSPVIDAIQATPALKELLQRTQEPSVTSETAHERITRFALGLASAEKKGGPQP